MIVPSKRSSTPRRMNLLRLMAFGLVAAVGSVASLSGQSETSAPGKLEAHVLWHKATALFPIRVVTPADFDSTHQYPAVLALHGFGGSPESLERVAGPFTRAGFVVVLPTAPYAVPLPDSANHSSWGLTTYTSPALTDDPSIEFQSTALTTFEFIPSVLDAVEQRYLLGPVYTFGFSLGGVEAILSGFYNRDRFDGIVAFGVRGFERDWFTVQGDSLEDGNHLPVLLVQGRSDPMVPFSDAEHALDLLEAAGYEASLFEFQGGHEIPREQVDRVVEWLNRLREP